MGHSRRRLEEILAHELLLALALLGLALIQTALLPRPFGVTINLLLLLAIIQGLNAGAASAARWAFYGGLALDLCAMSLLGMHALALLAAVPAATIPLSRLSRGNWLAPLAGTVFGGVTYHLVYALLTALLTGWFDPRLYIVSAALPDILIVLVPALPIWMLIRWNHDRRRGSVPVDVY